LLAILLEGYVRYYMPCGKRKARESPRQESLSGPCKTPSQRKESPQW
jgi:hypothetical protein